MAADDNIFDAKRSNRVFDAGRAAAQRLAVGRNDIACVPYHEDIAGLALCQELRRDAAIGTGDENRERCLRFAELPEQLRPRAIKLAPVT